MTRRHSIPEERFSPATERIHGQIVTPLPEGYRFEVLPEHISVSPVYNNPMELCHSHNVIKWIIQLTYAVSHSTVHEAIRSSDMDTVHWTDGDTNTQIMSFVNLLATCLTPDYPALYMVRSEVMIEAERRGGKFDGTIGIINVDNGTRNNIELHFETCQAKKESGAEITSLRRRGVSSCLQVRFRDPGGFEHASTLDRYPTVIVPSVGRHIKIQQTDSASVLSFQRCAIGAGILALVLPYAIIGGLTGFRVGGSSKAQRGWTMAWLVCSQFLGFASHIVVRVATEDMEDEDDWGAKRNWFRRVVMLIFISLIYGIPSIGGFVVVGKMINEFGSCVMTS